MARLEFKVNLNTVARSHPLDDFICLTRFRTMDGFGRLTRFGALDG